ncbi:MAG: hypothetical protein AAF640_12400 [Pseudomonadota bacterium]
MSEVLGYDCDGKPIHAGDLVQMVNLIRDVQDNGTIGRAVFTAWNERRGQEELCIDVGLPFPNLAACLFRNVRLLPRDSSSWGHLEQLLRWERPRIDEEITA